MIETFLKIFKTKNNFEQSLYYLKKKDYTKFFITLDKIETLQLKKLSTEIETLHKSLEDYNSHLNKLIVLNKDKDYNINAFRYTRMETISLRRWLYKDNILHNNSINDLKYFIKNGVDICTIYDNLKKEENIVISNFFKQYIINMCKILTSILDMEE